MCQLLTNEIHQRVSGVSLTEIVGSLLSRFLIFWGSRSSENDGNIITKTWSIYLAADFFKNKNGLLPFPIR